MRLSALLSTLDKPLDKRYETLEEWILLSNRKLFGCERDVDIENIWHAAFTFEASAGLQQLVRSECRKKQDELQEFKQEFGADW